MVLVVRAVKVLAVPASAVGQHGREADNQRGGRAGHSRGEMMDGHDTGGARLLREIGRLGESSVDVLQTSVAEPRVAAILGQGRAYGHAEPLSMSDGLLWLTLANRTHLLEGRDLLVAVRRKVLLDVVDRHATLDITE